VKYRSLNEPWLAAAFVKSNEGGTLEIGGEWIGSPLRIEDSRTLSLELSKLITEYLTHCHLAVQTEWVPTCESYPEGAQCPLPLAPNGTDPMP